jgi:hypothetical protein
MALVCPWSCAQVISSIDHNHYLNLSTLLLNEGNSRCGIHHDMPCPFPALILGQGSHELVDGVWQCRAVGGRLFLADGLVDISYGPTDIVLLDGNIPHGITNLRDFKGKGTCARAQLERFSAILFSGFKRDKMKKHGNYVYAWSPDHMSSVVKKGD